MNCCSGCPSGFGPPGPNPLADMDPPDFRCSFSDVNYSQNVIWNNKDIRINNKPVFYKTYFDKGITYLSAEES